MTATHDAARAWARGTSSAEAAVELLIRSHWRVPEKVDAHEIHSVG